MKGVNVGEVNDCECSIEVKRVRERVPIGVIYEDKVVSAVTLYSQSLRVVDQQLRDCRSQGPVDMNVVRVLRKCNEVDSGTSRDGVTNWRDRERLSGKTPVGLPKEHIDDFVRIVRGHHVRSAVAIQVGNRHKTYSLTIADDSKRCRRLKCSITISEENANCSWVSAGHGNQVRSTIPVHISNRD